MFRTMWTKASFGERYLTAALIYVGLALLLVAVAPGASMALAQTGGCINCAEGTYCCGGSCIPNDYVCCEDGTSGPSQTPGGQMCGCCTGCQSTCSKPPSYVCVQEAQ